MKTYTFAELLLREDEIKSLFHELKLNYNPNGRLNQYFKYLRKIEQARGLGKEKFEQIFQSDKTKYYYGMFYVLEICNIIEAIKNSNQDKNVIREKLEHMTKGTYLLSEETANNTIARNTTFELSLFSFFNKLGLVSNLGNPNPDLQLHTKSFTYDIECKRPSSLETLKGNIKKASKQLRNRTKTTNIPTIALSLDRVILGEDLILDTLNETSALEYLDRLLYNFSQENKKTLDRMFTDGQYLVLYYLSCLSGFRDKNLPMANATYIVGNIYNFDPDLSQRILKDLQTQIKIN